MRAPFRIFRMEVTVPIGRPRPALICNSGFGVLARGMRIAGVSVGAFPVPKPLAGIGAQDAGWRPAVLEETAVTADNDDGDSGADAGAGDGNKHGVVRVPVAEDVDVASEPQLTIGITEVTVSGIERGIGHAKLIVVAAAAAASD